VSDLQDLSYWAPEDCKRILREAFELHGCSLFATARGLGAPAETLIAVVKRLGLREEFRERAYKLRTRFADPETLPVDRKTRHHG
jgi:hypothetical protein